MPGGLAVAAKGEREDSGEARGEKDLAGAGEGSSLRRNHRLQASPVRRIACRPETDAAYTRVPTALPGSTN